MRALLAVPGLLVVVGLAIGLASSSSATEVSDPIGDTFGTGGADQLDISSMDAQYDATNLTITVNFSTPIQPTEAGASNSVFGFIYLDTDQDIDTGALIGDALGAEFVVDLLDDGLPHLTIVSNIESGIDTGNAPISFTDTSFTATVPLTAIGGDDGLVDYGVLLGAPDPAAGSEYFFFTDEAPNEGAATSEAAPQPTPTPSPAPTPSQLPATGGRPTGGSGLPWVAVAMGALLVASGGLVLVRRLRA
jgi:hypothetical protein